MVVCKTKVFHSLKWRHSWKFQKGRENGIILKKYSIVFFSHNTYYYNHYDLETIKKLIDCFKYFANIVNKSARILINCVPIFINIYIGSSVCVFLNPVSEV